MSPLFVYLGREAHILILPSRGKAYQQPPDEYPRKAFMMQMVEEECVAVGNRQRLPARWLADRDQFMILCVTCMGRDEQCKRALLINCAVLVAFLNTRGGCPGHLRG